VKDAGPRRRCPLCGEWFQETCPLGSGEAVRWVPRPFCSKHTIRKDVLHGMAATTHCVTFQAQPTPDAVHVRLMEARRRLAPYLRPTNEPWSQCDAGIVTQLCEVIDVLIDVNKEKKP
jgi:hypothetical protein